jgi:hypothetical protein
MKILAAKQFGPGQAAEIAEWINGCAGQGYDTVQVRLGIGARRMSNRAAREALARLTEAGQAVWKEGDYFFDFRAGAYLRCSASLWITPNEALFLYRWLVLKEVNLSQDGVLYRLRRRFGRAFLQEAAVPDRHGSDI